MYNSDGYVMIDMSDVDLTKSSQNIPGIYKRVLEVIDTNKLALIVNAGNNTPMAAVVHKKLNYYKITTLLYIFTINTNDIVIVEESGEATVDVEIVPTLTEGTKIADFSIGAVEGELFAPPQQSEINDNVTAVNSTWSSSKISTELSGKANSADVYTKAQVDTALSGKADTSDVYTKAQVDTALSGKADTSDVYTKAQVDTALSAKANAADVYTKSEVDTALANISDYSSTEKAIGKWTDGKTIYRQVLTGTIANNVIDLSVGEKIDTCVNYSLLVNKNGINFKAPYRMEDGANYYQIYCFCNNASGNTNSNVYATFASSTADYFNGCDVTCIVEYTKR